MDEVLSGITIDNLILGKKGSYSQKGRFIYVNYYVTGRGGVVARTRDVTWK